MRRTTKQRTLFGGMFALVAALVVVMTGNTFGLYSATESQGGNALAGATFSPSTAPQATVTQGSSTVTINWSAVTLTGGSHTGTIKYTVVRTQDSAVICTLTASTTCIDGTGIAGTSYTYTEQPFYVVSSTSTWSLAVSSASAPVTFPTLPTTTCANNATFVLHPFTTVRYTAVGGGGGNGASGGGTGAGAGGSGAAGAKVTGTLTNSTTSDVPLTCKVGTAGSNNSGTTGGAGGTGDKTGGAGGTTGGSPPRGGAAGGGGGSTAILVNTTTLLVVAGGGGGGAGGGATGGAGGSATVNTTISGTAADANGAAGTGDNAGGSGGGGGAGATVGGAAAAGANTTSGGTAGTGGSSYGDSGGTVTESGTAAVSGANAGGAGSITFATVTGLVQATGGSNGNSSSITVNLPATSNAGDTLVVSAYGPSNCGTINVSDSATNTYTKESVTSTGNAKGLFAYVVNSAAITSVTITCTNNSRIQFSVAEFIGFRPGFDQSHSGSNAGSTALSSGTTPTTTGTADLVVGAAGWGSSAALNSQTSGFAQADTQSQNNQATELLKYQVVSSAGTFSFGGTLASSTDWAAFVYAFKAG